MQLVTDFLLVIGQNLLLHDLLGLPAAVYGTKKENGFVRLGFLTLLFSTAISGMMALVRGLFPPAYEKLLFPLCTAVFCGLFDLLLLGILRLVPEKFSKYLRRQIHAAAFSGAVLGIVLMSTEYTHEFHVALRYGIRTGLGYLIACVLLKLASPAVCSEKMPQAVRGWKGLYLYAALLSAAVYCMFPSLS